MEVSHLLQHSQYAIPVGFVLVCAILVFVFGFKKAEQPPFAQLSGSNDVERKLGGKKRSKTREKRAANGQVTTEKSSPAKKVSPVKAEPPTKKSTKSDDVEGKLKERKQEDNKPAALNKKEKVQETKSGKENKIEQTKNKKNLKNVQPEKPVDFDDGDWEQAYSRKDKKNKRKEEETPSKKSKKAKKAEAANENVEKSEILEKPEIKDKVAKETVNKELKEKDTKDVILTPIIDNEPEKEKEEEKIPEKIVEKKVDSNKQTSKVDKPEKEEKKTKSKKSKKTVDTENVTPAPEAPVTKPDTKSNAKVAEPKVEEVIVKVDVVDAVVGKPEEVKETKVAAFDELGDVWTEAKPPKKSKKKARRDN